MKAPSPRPDSGRTRSAVTPPAPAASAAAFRRSAGLPVRARTSSTRPPAPSKNATAQRCLLPGAGAIGRELTAAMPAMRATRSAVSPAQDAAGGPIGPVLDDTAPFDP